MLHAGLQFGILIQAKKSGKLIQVGQGNLVAKGITIDVTNQQICNEKDGNVKVLQPLGQQYTYSLNGGPFQSSAEFKDLAPGTYKMIYYDQVLKCESKVKEFNIQPIACNLNPELLCKVFVDVKGVIETGNTFNLVISDDISSILESIC